MTRILIADPHYIVREGLRIILQTQANWEVVAEVANGKEAILKAVETKPDIAILDTYLPLVDSLEVTRQIRAQLPKTEILIFTTHNDETLIREALKAGARGYLIKSDPNVALISAIQSLAIHKQFLTAQFSDASMMSSGIRPKQSSALTNRERGVVQLIASGHSNKQTARVLDISLKTVETHRSAVMRKLNLPSSAALVRYAVRNMIVEP